MSGSDDSEMTSAPDARPESESFGIRSVRLPLRCVGGGRRSTVSLIVSRSGDLAITFVTFRPSRSSPLTATIRSPGIRPVLAAGVPSSMLVM